MESVMAKIWRTKLSKELGSISSQSTTNWKHWKDLIEGWLLSSNWSKASTFPLASYYCCYAKYGLLCKFWHENVRRLIQWFCSIKGYISDTNPRPVTLLHQKALVNNRLWHIVRVGRSPHVFWNDRHIKPDNNTGSLYDKMNRSNSLGGFK